MTMFPTKINLSSSKLTRKTQYHSLVSSMPPGLNYLAFLTVILWLSAPKITLFGVSGFEQGIRTEDILFLVVYFWFIVKNINLPASNFILGGRYGVYFILYLFLSSLLSIFFLGSSSGTLVFSARWLEYYAMAVIIVSVVSNQLINIVIFSKIFLVFNLIYSIIWIFANGIGERYEGLSEGPWEISSVLLLLFIGIIPWLKPKQILLYGVMVAFVMLTAKARIQMGAFIGLIIFDKDLRKIFINKFTISISCLMTFYFANDLVEIMRFDKLNISALTNMVDVLRDAGFGADFYELSGRNIDVDEALLSRIMIWMTFIKIWLDAGLHGYIFGIGPGRGGVVVDGFYIRLVVEFGLLGMLFFYSAIREIMGSLMKIDRIRLLVAMGIISLTNDPFTSQRIFAAFCAAIAMLTYAYVGNEARTNVRK